MWYKGHSLASKLETLMVVSMKGLVSFIILHCLACWQRVASRTLNTKEEFVAWHSEAKQGNFGEEIIELGANIDFAGETLTPLGLSDDGTCTPFQGTFDGHNFEIGGLNMSRPNSMSSLFCSLQDATVQNLVVAASCNVFGDPAASIAAYACNAVFINVVNHASPTSPGFASGICGVSNQADRNCFLKFIECRNTGYIQGSGCSSGFLADSNAQEVMFINCTNEGAIGGASKRDMFHGGFGGYVRNKIVIINGTNTGNVESLGARNAFSGGFIGIAHIVQVTNATNKGNIRSNGYHISRAGGICGIAADKVYTEPSFVHDSMNEGDVEAQTFGNYLNMATVLYKIKISNGYFTN